MPGVGYILLNYWLKGSHRTPAPQLQISQAISKAIGYSLQPDNKAILVKTLFTYIIEHREFKLVLTEKLNPYYPLLIRIHSVGRYLACYYKNNYYHCHHQYHPAINPVTCNNDLTATVKQVAVANHLLI